MPRILKNIVDGIGSVLLDVTSPAEYRKVSGRGFRSDAESLSADSRTIVRRLTDNVKRNKIK